MFYLDTMVRIRSIDQILRFYGDGLGLIEIRRTQNQKGRFTLFFHGAPEDPGLALSDKAPILELTYGAARNIRLLVDKAVPCGIAYGLATYGVMNYVVMPLSAIHSIGDSGPAYIRITGVLVHMFLIGLPIALITRRGLR